MLRTARLGLIGQTPEIAPADRKLYALRDVTGTVESLPLIAASIMSKKMAEGIDALVLDVKTGDGAFMQSLRGLEGAGRDHGRASDAAWARRSRPSSRDMEQPLGRTVGNALEVAECVETLKGRGPRDLESLSLELAAWMLHAGRRLAQPGGRARAGARRARLRRGPAQAPGGHRACRAATRASCDDARACPGRAETRRARAPRPTARVAGIALPRGRARGACCWAPDARRWTATSTPRWASSSTRRSATSSRRASR